MADQDKPAPPKKSDVRKLIDHFATTHHLVHNQGQAYIIPGRSGPPYPFDGPPGVAQPFGAPLRRKIVQVSRVSSEVKLVSRAAAETVMLHLEAVAFGGEETPIALRFAQGAAESCVRLDLGRADGRVLVIRPDGWEVLGAELGGGAPGEPPRGVVFRRSHATRPLPIPTRGGRLVELAELLALDADDVVFKALLGWAVGLPFVASVRPGVLLVGPPGTGKSTRLRLVASLVEPSGLDALGSAFGRNHADDQVRALHRAVPLWDNLTSVSGDTSDLLCCLVTGTAREGRLLFTNNDMSTAPIARPVGLTAVGVPAGLRPDALDRLIVLEAPPVPARIEDAEVQRRFDAAHPRLLGALADAVAAALRWRDRVAPPTEYRMAAHARVLAAVGAAVKAGELGGCPAGLLDAYAEVVRQRAQRTAADDTFGAALLALLEARGGQWKGKAGELLYATAMHAPYTEQRLPGWPSSPRRVPEVLNHLRDGLAALGVTWTTSTVVGSTRYTFAQRPAEG